MHRDLQRFSVAREFLNNWRFRLELDSRADGGLQINPKKSSDYYGVGAEVGRPIVGLMLAMPRKHLWLFSDVQDPSQPGRSEKLATATSADSIMPTLLSEMNGAIYCAGEDGSKRGCGLWKMIPSTGKRELVKGGYDIRPHAVYAWENRVLFSVDKTTGKKGPPSRSLWISDGTRGNATKLADVGAVQFTPFNGELYFAAVTGAEMAPKPLWKTDGTPGGTLMVDDKVWPGSTRTATSTNLIMPALDRLFIAGGTYTSSGSIRVFDREGKKTRQIAEVVALRHERWGAEFAGKFFFVSIEKKNQSKTGLWVSDGTAEGTSRFAAEPVEPDALTPAGPRMFFTAAKTGKKKGEKKGRALWCTDGTKEGMGLVRDLWLGNDENPRQLTALGDRLVFAANDGRHGGELWVSDGTAAGTQMLKDINPGSYGSMIGDMVALGKHVYFTASDGRLGLELWRSDGTTAGTEAIDILPGSRGSVPRELLVANGKLYFYTMTTPQGREIWEYDPAKGINRSGVIPSEKPRN